jgi:uncharacterized iron-regulated membrane protein
MNRVLPVLRLLHAWVGLVLSLALLVMALSGSLLVFRTEILRLTVPGAAARVDSDPVALARAATAAEAAFGPKVASMNFASPAFGLHQVNLTGGGGAYLDPATGRVVGRWAKNERFFDWLFDLHHHLLSGETGTRTAGWIGFGGLVLSLVGIVLWIPARGSFRGRVVPSSPKRPRLLAAHRDLGILAAPVLLIMLTCGAGLALPNQVRPLLAAAFGGAAEAKAKPPKVAPAPADWPAALAAAHARFPDAELRMAVWPKKPGQPLQVRLRRPGEWHTNGRTSVSVDPSGRVLAAVDAQALGRGARIYNGLWPVHASRVGGLPWKLLTLLGGLSLTALSLYGAVAFAPKAFGFGGKARARRGVDA